LIIFVLALGPLMVMTCAHLLGRARAAETPDQRRALTVAAAAGACVPAAFLACLGMGLEGGDTAQIGVIENLGTVAVAVACWYGIIGYGLFDSRAVLSRTLLYGALTVVVVAVYLAATALLRQLFAGDVPAVVAAGVAGPAVRGRVHRPADRAGPRSGRAVQHRRPLAAGKPGQPGQRGGPGGSADPGSAGSRRPGRS
jgi:two-component system, NarL family, sensor kinase